MKPKLLLGLALVIGGSLFPLVARAATPTLSVNQTNLTKFAPFVRVIASKTEVATNETRMDFSVVVLLKDKQTFTGGLLIKDSAGAFIAYSSVAAVVDVKAIPHGTPESWAGKCVVFHFEVNATHLSQSDFLLEENDSTEKETIWPAVVFSFNLKEFSTAK